ncbi:MAG: hypothetical protein U0174_02875 [Polyangiaceae bacterium]
MTSLRTSALSVSVLTAALAVVAAPRMALAAERPPPLVLDYATEDDAEGCPDEAGLRAMIAARLGYDPFAPSAKRTIVTRIRKSAAKFRTRIELRDGNGKLLGVRELEANTCADLAASTAFAMAVAIDPDEAHAPREPGEHSTAPPPPPIAPPPPPPPTQVSAPPPPPPVAAPPRGAPWVPTLFVGAHGGAFGPYASVAFGGSLGIVLEHGAFAAGVEASASLPNTTAVNTGVVRTGVMGMSPLLCARVSELSLCGRVFLGAFQGAAEGVDTPDKKTTFFSSAGILAAYRFRPFGSATQPSPFGLEPYLGADVVLTRTRVTFRGVEVWSTAPATLEAGLRATVSFF